MRTFIWLLLGLSFLVIVPLVANTGSALKTEAVPVVLDSSGKIVGTVVDTNFWSGSATGLPTVAFRTGQETVFVGVTTNSFFGNTNSMLFGTADCTGTAYFQYPGPHPGPLGPSLVAFSFVKNDGTLYAAPGSSPSPTTVNINSAFYEATNPSGPDVCQPFAIGDTQVIEADPVANLTGMFQPPFVLR